MTKLATVQKENQINQENHSQESDIGLIETNPIYTSLPSTVSVSNKIPKESLTTSYENPVYESVDDHFGIDQPDSSKGSTLSSKQSRKADNFGAKLNNNNNTSTSANDKMDNVLVVPVNGGTVNGPHPLVNGFIGNEPVLKSNNKQYDRHIGDGDSGQFHVNGGTYNGVDTDSGEIELNDGHREMAIDVPASFLGGQKETPRYPPPQPAHPAPNRPKDDHNGVSQTPTGEQLERIRKYQEELRKKREQEESRAAEQEFLRASLRGSKKLQSLEERQRAEPPIGIVNTGFLVEDDEAGDEDPYEIQGDATLPVRGQNKKQKPDTSQQQDDAQYRTIPLGNDQLLATLRHIESQIHSADNQGDITFLAKLFQESKFQQAVAVHQKVLDVTSKTLAAPPTCNNALDVTQEVQESLGQSDNGVVEELLGILRRSEVRGLMLAHDRIAKRETLPGLSADEEMLYDRVTQYGQESVKIVRLLKSNDPLGATVRNEGESVIVGRIVKGGAAEKSGLLHEGDEVLEVNGIDMRGKSVNDVCDLLANMTGTLTFLIIPNQETLRPQTRDLLIHIKAHFEYDPEDDLYIPCRELGISFAKGDILHVINQDDANWWQAYREGEDDQALAGLIPSKSFQEQREAMKQTIAADNDKKNKKLLCGKKKNKKKKRKLYNATTNDELESEEILTYEEVALYYPQPNRKRPVVMIGPPGVGRQELRQRLMESDTDRFAAAIPHTSRPRKDSELDDKDYFFVQRHVFEADIIANKFVEHGEFEKNLYGTSLESIRFVVSEGKICVLNLHAQSLKILKASDLKPYVVFIAPPNLEKLRHNRMKAGEKVHDDDLKAIIERAREVEENFGHYFDMVIVNYDIDKAYSELLTEINRLEVEPQWVPAHWIQT